MNEQDTAHKRRIGMVIEMALTTSEFIATLKATGASFPYRKQHDHEDILMLEGVKERLGDVYRELMAQYSPPQQGSISK